MAKEMRVFLFFLVKRVGERGVGMAFLTGLKWGTFYCNVVIVMACVAGITITALQ